jgi:hypothetical protein
VNAESLQSRQFDAISWQVFESEGIPAGFHAFKGLVFGDSNLFISRGRHLRSPLLDSFLAKGKCAASERGR